MYNILFLLLITATFFSANKTKAQEFQLVSNKYTLVNGDTVSQPGNNIMVVFQDSKNRYWFGSWETGLYKYDGKTIIHFTTKHGLPGIRIEEIKEDKLGNIFINTNNGLCKYDGRQIMKIPNSLHRISNWSLHPDDLWFKSQQIGFVSRYDGNMLHQLKVPKSELGEEYLKKHPNAFDPYGIYCIYKDIKGHIWFGTALFGAFRYNGKSFNWISETDVTELHDGPANGVRSIIEDKDGFFWFNTDYRYKIIDNTAVGNSIFYERLKSVGSLDGIQNNNLNEYLSITKDQNNNVWIATYRNGVWKYDGKEIKHYSIHENGRAINLFYIYKDKQGDLWLGTHQNGIWKLKGEKFERFML